MNKIFDVIIVGAGPSGGIASIKLAEKGLKILIIEKKAKIGEPVQCGEGLSEFALKENKINPDTSFIDRKVKGAKIITPSGYKIFFLIPGYLIKRDKFDKYLISIAREKGAEIKTKEKVLNINKKQNFFEVISEKNKYLARYVILANGCNGKIKGIKNLNFQKIVAIEFRFRKNNIDDEYLNFYLGNKFKPFYGWVFFHKNEVGIGAGFSGYKNNLHPIYELMKKYSFTKEHRIRVISGKIPFSKPVIPGDPEGLLRIGDAIGAINPFTAAGIHGALTTGRIAAETIIENFDKREINSIYYKKIKKLPIFRNSLWNKQKKLFNKNSKEWDEIGKLMDGKNYYETPWIRAIFYLFLKPFSTFNLLFFLNLQKEFKISENYSY